jgi:hypothetical protein
MASGVVVIRSACGSAFAFRDGRKAGLVGGPRLGAAHRLKR